MKDHRVVKSSERKLYKRTIQDELPNVTAFVKSCVSSPRVIVH